MLFYCLGLLISRFCIPQEHNALYRRRALVLATARRKRSREHYSPRS